MMTRVCFGLERSGLSTSSASSPWLRKGATAASAFEVPPSLLFSTVSSSSTSSITPLSRLLSPSAMEREKVRIVALLLYVVCIGDWWGLTIPNPELREKHAINEMSKKFDFDCILLIDIVSSRVEERDRCSMCQVFDACNTVLKCSRS